MIKINGVTISENGRHIVITNNDIYIDGQKTNLDQFGDEKNFKVEVSGSVAKIETGSASVSVTGNVVEVSTASGSVKINGDADSISTMSGSVKVGGSVSGKISTMSGSISHR